jgi:hypothetical protein
MMANFDSIQRGEGDLPKVAVRYSMQESVIKRGKVRVERELEWVDGSMAWNGIIKIIIY